MAKKNSNGFMDFQLPSVFDIIDNLSFGLFSNKPKTCVCGREECKSKKKSTKKTAKKKKKV